MSLSPWFERAEVNRQLAVDGLCKAYGRVPALFPLSFTLEPGEGLALLGPNGSGKTTLLRLIAGVSRPSDGMIRFVDSLSRGTVGRPIRVGLVGHDSYLYPDLTGFENLRFFLSLGHVGVSDLQVAGALDAVGMLAAANDRVASYSAGMQRRTGLARLLLAQPDLLLMDEPHASLDADGQALVDGLIEAAKASGRSVVIASHDQDRTLELCEEMIVLDGGRVSFQGLVSDWRAHRHIRLLDTTNDADAAKIAGQISDLDIGSA